MMGAPGLIYPLSLHSTEAQRLKEERANTIYRMAIYQKNRAKYELAKQSGRNRISSNRSGR